GLTGPVGGAIRYRGDLFHAAQHLAHALRLILCLGRERRRELHRGVRIAEDRVERAVHRRRHAADALRRLTALAHRLDDAIDLVLRRAHARPHLFRRAGALLGELAHFAGDDAEAEAMLPGARGLDRRVEGQQVGLTRDTRDAIYELADLARFAVEHARHLRGVVHVHHQVH